MTSRRIRFFFDYVSPYAYLASTRIAALAARHGADVERVPVLFAGLLEAHGTRGPAEVPARRRYLIRDVARLARAFGVPFELPPAHPFNPLLALRVSSLSMPEPQRAVLVDGLFAAAWVNGRDLADPAVVADVAASAGLPGGALDAAAGSDAKAALRARTAEAVALGVFGVPSMIVGTELFWGCDSLPHLARHLDGEAPVPPDLAARWERLPAGATRQTRSRPS